MQRRQFVEAVTASVLLSRIARAESLPADLKVTRIVSFDLHTRRPKFVGKNAVRDDHGWGHKDRMARLYTNVGVEALGRCWRGEASLASLLGKNPFEGFDPASRRIISPLGPLQETGAAGGSTGWRSVRVVSPRITRSSPESGAVLVTQTAIGGPTRRARRRKVVLRAHRVAAAG